MENLEWDVPWFQLDDGLPDFICPSHTSTGRVVSSISAMDEMSKREKENLVDLLCCFLIERYWFVPDQYGCHIWMFTAILETVFIFLFLFYFILVFRLVLLVGWFVFLFIFLFIFLVWFVWLFLLSSSSSSSPFSLFYKWRYIYAFLSSVSIQGLRRSSEYLFRLLLRDFKLGLLFDANWVHRQFDGRFIVLLS